MIQNLNGGWIKLLEKNERNSAWDLEVKQHGKVIEVKIKDGGINDLGFTIEEIEALYRFAQMVKLNY
jgi:hypothetical protein